MKTMADLIDDLFRSHRKPNGREYSHVEVCQALAMAIEPSHMGKMRNGTIKNPKRDTLLALCQFFQVSPTYFFPELPPMGVPDEEEQGELVSALMGTIQLPLEAKRELAAFLRALQTPQQHRDTPLPENDLATAATEL